MDDVPQDVLDRLNIPSKTELEALTQRIDELTRLVDALEDLDDVQEVFTNADIADDALEGAQA